MTELDSNLAPRILVVDGSKVTRKMIENCIRADVPGADVIACETAADAKKALETGEVTLITTALRLPDEDGVAFARYVREHAPQAFIPIIVVSGDVQDRLVNRSFTDDITDYFDKSLGFTALAAFIRGYVSTDNRVQGTVLYVEDSKVVAVATRRMMEKNGLSVLHKMSAEEAIDVISEARQSGQMVEASVVLSDVYLKGGLTGKDLLMKVRGDFAYTKTELPVLIMTGDDNPANQSALIKEGANDIVQKPIEERRLINKLRFQMTLAQNARRAVLASRTEA
jgi:CheY-like chemotaxis protein